MMQRISQNQLDRKSWPISIAADNRDHSVSEMLAVANLAEQNQVHESEDER